METASQVYEQLRVKGLEGRELEASLLTRAARKLSRCAEMWVAGPQTKEFRDKFEEALSFNQRLWTFLQVELSNPQHPMSQALRTDLLQLSHFIDKTTFHLRAGGSVDEMVGLARINEQIAAGLMLTTGPQVPAVPETTESRNYPLNVTA